MQSVDRALRILLAFERPAEELGLGELATRLGVHKSTASRLAATLEARGFLRRDGDAFRLGVQLMRLGLLVGPAGSLIDVAREPMQALAQRSRECVTLSVAVEGAAVSVAEVGAPFVVGAASWIGYRTPLHATSDGKVLLAFGAARLDEQQRLEARTPRTIVARPALEAELEGVRERGFALALGELEDHLHGVAAPVRDGSGSCLAALSVSGPDYRMSRERLLELADPCREAAAGIGVLAAGATGWSAA